MALNCKSDANAWTARQNNVSFGDCFFNGRTGGNYTNFKYKFGHIFDIYFDKRLSKICCELFKKGILGESKTKKASMGKSELKKDGSRHQHFVSARPVSFLQSVKRKKEWKNKTKQKTRKNM